MKKNSVLSLAVLFLLGVSLSAQSWSKLNGKGPIVKHEVNIDKIDGFSLGVLATVYLTQGKQQSIRVEAQQNIYDKIDQRVRKGHWEIKLDDDLRDHEPIKIYITMSDLESLNIGGSGVIKCTNHFKNLEDVDLNIGGSGKVKFKGDAQDISCNIGGLGTVEMSGRSEGLEINIGGSGKVYGVNMETDRCEINSAGSSDVEIHVNDRLEVSMVGSGNIQYKGSPKISKTILGSGEVTKI